MKTAEDFETSSWFANLLIKLTTALNFSVLTQLLKSKSVRIDTVIKHTVVNSEMIYQPFC